MKISIKRVQNDACTGSAEREKFGTQFKKTMRFLSMAALALVGAVMTGCSSDDNITNEPQQPSSKVVTLTTTVSLDDGAQTRALTSAGVKTFAEGEQIALVYKNTGGTTVKAVSEALTNGNITNEGKSATFTFELTNPDKSENVTYIYPAVMANADGTVNYDALATQNGTLATLSSTLDLCTYSHAWNGTSLPDATLANQLAILALTLKDDNGTADTGDDLDVTSNITGVTLSDGTNTYTVTRSAEAGPIYVAIKPTTSADITVTATDGSKNYTKSLNKTYEASNGYSVTWKTPEYIALSNVTNEHIGRVIAADGKVYKSASSATTAGTSARAIIAYVGAAGSVETGNSTYKGLAIAMSDANSGEVCQWKSDQTGKCVSLSTVNVSDARNCLDGIASTATLTGSGCSSHGHDAATHAVNNNGTAAPTGCSTWFLPSLGQWQLIVQGLTGKSDALTNDVNNNYKTNAVNAKITAAGGTGFKDNNSGDYWSSTEYGDYKRAWVMEFINGNPSMIMKDIAYPYVRSVLAF